MRKSLLWILTIVLMAAFAFLIINGQQLKKKDAENSKESVQQSQSTAIRVIAPDDLQIINSKISIEPNKIARHQLEIRNEGKVSYKRIYIRFIYMDKAGRALGQKEKLIEEICRPGAVLVQKNIIIQNIPDHSDDVKVQIAFADMKSSE